MNLGSDGVLLAEAARPPATNGPLDRRLVAIRLLGLGDAKDGAAVFPTLLDARQPTPVQLTVLQTLSGLFDRDMARQILLHGAR